ncbi:hypothetical protein JCM11641_001252 [Rhodosporidiobolus odoratus]
MLEHAAAMATRRGLSLRRPGNLFLHTYCPYLRQHPWLNLRDTRLQDQDDAERLQPKHTKRKKSGKRAHDWQKHHQELVVRSMTPTLKPTLFLKLRPSRHRANHPATLSIFCPTLLLKLFHTHRRVNHPDHPPDLGVLCLKPPLQLPDLILLHSTLSRCSKTVGIQVRLLVDLLMLLFVVLVTQLM